MASGVTVQDECVTKFNEIKLQHNMRYLIYGATDDNRQIEVKSIGSKDKTYNDFLNELDDKTCRYAIFDLSFYNKENVLQEKLVFIAWSPDTAPVRQKMLYASSKDALKKKLVGIAVEVQATDRSEVSYETVIDKAQSKGH